MTDAFGHADTFHAIAHGVGMIPETDYSVLPDPNQIALSLSLAFK